MSLICLDYFSYHHTESTKDSTVYRDCVILRPFGKYKVGDRIDTIVVQTSFHIWENDDYVDEIVIIL